MNRYFYCYSMRYDNLLCACEKNRPYKNFRFKYINTHDKMIERSGANV